MADINSTAEEKTSEQEINVIKESSTNTALFKSSENIADDVSMEPEKTAEGNEIVPSSPGSQSDTGKISAGKSSYTEEEKLKRKEFFRQQREKKKLLYQRSKLALSKNPRSKLDKTITISYDMTDDDKKMLEFYQVRLSVLKQENQELHKRLSYLVEENMRYLQRGPPTQVRCTL